MGAHVLVRHKVRAFSEWKRSFDAHLPKRVAAGLSDRYVFRGVDDPNEVFVLLAAEDLSRAKAFADSPDLRETMQKAGVLDKPDVYFLND